MMVLDIGLTPKPSETIFSLLTRAHILSGRTSPLVSLQYLTGHRGYKPLSSLPSSLNQICSSLHLEAKPEQVIEKHTMFPLFKPFLPESRREFVIQAMLNCGATKSRLGLLKSHCGASEQLAYCSECVKDDTFKFGFPYWHREHSLVGVEICHLHKSPLTKIYMGSCQFGTRCLQLPGELITPNRWNEVQYSRHCFIAEQVALITNTRNDIVISRHSYHQLLIENNLLTKSNHIRMKNLQAVINDWLEPLANMTPFNELISALGIERNWIANLVAGKVGMHHPIKHIVLWGALETNLRDFNDGLESVEQLTLPLISASKPEITKELLEDVVSRVGSAAASARFLNCSIQTVLVLMDKFGLDPKRKPKKLNQEIINRVLDYSSKGIPTAKIAIELGLSISTVNRIKRSNR